MLSLIKMSSNLITILDAVKYNHAEQLKLNNQSRCGVIGVRKHVWVILSTWILDQLGSVREGTSTKIQSENGIYKINSKLLIIVSKLSI